MKYDFKNHLLTCTSQVLNSHTQLVTISSAQIKNISIYPEVTEIKVKLTDFQTLHIGPQAKKLRTPKRNKKVQRLTFGSP